MQPHTDPARNITDQPLVDQPVSPRLRDHLHTGRHIDFEQFIEQHGRDLGRLAFLMIGDHDMADDLTSDALLVAWQRWDVVQASDHPMAYLRRVVINLAASRVRRLVREQRRMVLLRGDAMWPAASSDHADVVDVRSALLHLPPRQRACVVLRYAFDLSEQDVAQQLGISIGTVKSQTAKASEHLRRALGATSGRRESRSVGPRSSVGH